MTNIGEEWDYAKHRSEIFDPNSWQRVDDPNHWSRTANYWGKLGAFLNISARGLGDYEIKLTGNEKEGRWSYWKWIQGRYTVTRNEPGYLTVRIRGGTDWSFPFSNGGFWGAYDDPTNLIDITLTVEPFIVGANTQIVGSKAVMRVVGTMSRYFDIKTLTPFGTQIIDSGQVWGSRTRENGEIQYGLSIQGPSQTGSGSMGGLTWSPINKKEKRRTF